MPQLTVISPHGAEIETLFESSVTLSYDMQWSCVK